MERHVDFAPTTRAVQVEPLRGMLAFNCRAAHGLDAVQTPKAGRRIGLHCRMNRALLLLTLCQGLFLTNNVTFIAINGLVGLQLAPFGWMATLPLTLRYCARSSRCWNVFIAGGSPAATKWMTWCRKP